MKITELCPQCGTVAYPVGKETVLALVARGAVPAGDDPWYACLEKNCVVAYCSKGTTISTGEVTVPLWYKDDRDSVPICYCSKLTRGEIENALRKGCVTIDDVQHFTGKNITGKCRTENPLGECCRNVFLKTMAEAVPARKLKVLFLCTGNSCRSQMAEGWARHLKGDTIECYSAGIETHGLNLRAVLVMKEAGVDISRHHSKHFDEVMHIPFDWVITVCDNAHESCPVFPGGAKRFHVSFDDPPKLAKDAKSENEVLVPYRRVRDEIRHFCEKLPAVLSERIPTQK